MLNENLLPIIIAGLINGSFVVPARYIKNTSSEKIWFYHSLIGLSIIPWLIFFLFLPAYTIQNYAALSINVWAYIVFGGMFFGVGQVCFSHAIKKIGIALSFAINLGIGVTIGSMFVVFHDSAFFTMRGFFVTLAVFLIISSLIVYYFSERITNNIKNNYCTGWLFASFAGIASGLQNITFVFVGFYANTQFHNINSFWVWPPFLLSSAVPMTLLFLYQVKKNRESIVLPKTKSLMLVTLMGVFFTGSLFLYSSGMSHLPDNQKMFGWPMLMVLIILTSQVWGWIFSEFKTSKKNSRVASVLLLVISIIFLSLKS